MDELKKFNVCRCQCGGTVWYYNDSGSCQCDQCDLCIYERSEADGWKHTYGQIREFFHHLQGEN